MTKATCRDEQKTHYGIETSQPVRKRRDLTRRDEQKTHYGIETELAAKLSKMDPESRRAENPLRD